MIVIALFSSCTIKENIQRDILLETGAMLFDIPVTTDLTDTLTLATLSSTADLNTIITENTKQFTASDVKSFRITSFQVEIENSDTTQVVNQINTFRAFEYVKVQLKKSNDTLLDIGRINNSAMTSGSIIQIPITAIQDLKDEISTGKFTYIITGVARTPTTKIMNARAVAQYKLTLGI
ncbi:hypothetical protein [Pedobacter sp. CG_S7]|uniref:hypothetical protein n=1 Tax=Pedobacter sp. CG_S7 TaxID=3143930 RepID=UPI003395E90F